MKLKNHIAYRFLTDEDFWWEILEKQMPDEIKEEPSDKLKGMYRLLRPVKNHVPRYITKTVDEKMEYLKLKRKDGVLDWTIFKNVKDGQYTYIFSFNQVIRVVFEEETIHVFLLSFSFNENSKNAGVAKWTLIYMDRLTGERCSHINELRGHITEEIAYRLLCFIHISEIEEKIIERGHKWGTRKTGKIINTLPFDLMRIDSAWNVTSIRTDEFGVKGHFAIRWTGKGREIPKLVWINPFVKKGYVRKAKKESYE